MPFAAMGVTSRRTHHAHRDGVCHFRLHEEGCRGGNSHQYESEVDIDNNPTRHYHYGPALGHHDDIPSAPDDDLIGPSPDPANQHDHFDKSASSDRRISLLLGKHVGREPL